MKKKLNYNLNTLVGNVHNEFCNLNDDVQSNMVTEFFRSLAEGQWEEEMADALEQLYGN